MNPRQYERIALLFEQARELTDDELIAFLHQHAADDTLVRDRVANLVQKHRLHRNQFELTRSAGTLVGMVFEPPQPMASGQSLGQFEILGVIGEGGMGIVYRARQLKPQRTVALKVLRNPLLSGSVLRRFWREADVLAQLEHPGIARVYEAGTFNHPDAPPGATAQPYLAMELVEGLPLDRYLSTSQLPLRALVELFVQICDAVEYAHQRGVIHRDLKPSNILVTSAVEGRASPPHASTSKTDHQATAKILDFGVARVMNDLSPLSTLHTREGQIIGTVPYMSPEQISGESHRVDVRSDVYALGVLLFEALTGRLPYDLRGRSLMEAARIIREEEPSRLVSTGGGSRSIRADRELETIVLKTLEKEPSRRYATVGQLGADLTRYLRDEPIVARPSGTWYQLAKFAKRNKALVGGVAATILTLTAGLIVSLLLFQQATIARKRESDAAQTSLRNEHRAQRAAYIANIGAAVAALGNDDISTATTYLNAASVESRGWEWRHLRSSLDTSSLQMQHTRNTTFFDQVLMRPHSASVLLLQRADAISTGWRSAIVEYDALTGDGPSEPLFSTTTDRMVSSPHARCLAMVDSDARLHVFRLSTGQTLGTWKFDSEIVHVMYNFWAISDNGRWVAYRASEWDTRDESLVVRIDLHEQSTVRCPVDIGLEFTLNDAGDMLLWNRESRDILYWRKADESITRLEISDGNTRMAAFSEDGRWFAVGGFDTRVHLCESATLRRVGIGTGHRDAICALRFSHDGTRLASGSMDCTVRLWNIPAMTPQGSLRGHRAAINDYGISFSHDDQLLVSHDHLGESRTWKLDQALNLGVLRGHASYVYPVAYSADGSQLASASWDQTIRIWDPVHYELRKTIPTRIPVIDRIVFHPDGNALIATGVLEKTKLCFGWYDLRQQRQMAVLIDQHLDEKPLMWPHRREPLVVLSLDRDTNQALTWDMRNPDELQWREFDASQYISDPHRGAPTSHEINMCVRDNHLYLRSTATGEWQRKAQVEWSYNHALSPPATPFPMIAAAEAGTNDVLVWDARTLEQTARLKAHNNVVFAVAWSPDGTRLATAGRDRSIHLWNTETWEEVAILRGHQSYIWSLAFSPDGTQLASGSGDYTVRIWDTYSLAERLRAAKSMRDARSAPTGTGKHAYRAMGAEIPDDR